MPEKKTSASKALSAKDVIKSHLDARAASDPLFAASYAKPKKNIDDCFRYILSEAQKRGNAVCMSDEEVFGLAVHYYDEDDIKIAQPAVSASVSHSHTKASAHKLSKAEKEAARAEAMRIYQQQCLADMQKQAKPKKAAAATKQTAKPSPKYEQPPLFDL